MKSPVNFDIQMPNLNAAAPSPSTVPDSPSSAASNYAPSVPISVYRELAAELQNTKGKLNTLNTQNQQLIQQNQRLRQEIQKLIQSAVQTQQIVEALPAIRLDPAAVSTAMSAEFEGAAEVKAKAATAAPAARSKSAKASQSSSKRPSNGKAPNSGKPSEVYVIEQEDKRPIQSASKKASDMGGLWLAIAIILIIVSAFGAGFLIVRPFISAPASE